MSEEKAIHQLILFCIVCCTPVDVEGAEGDKVTTTCGACGQVFSFVLSPERVAQHGQY